MVAQRVNLELAYILHRRPYSNTSYIIDFFTENHGRVSAMARSARGLKSRYRGKLELFSPMLIAWSGRGELKTLGTVEYSQAPMLLGGDALLCGFYLNELLVRLLHPHDPHRDLFYRYKDTLTLMLSQDLAFTLRIFEKHLLHQLGYGLALEKELQSGLPIDPVAAYQYVPDRGFIRCPPTTYSENHFQGESLLSLHREQFTNQACEQEAKRLMRLAIGAHLGNKPLKSRDLLKKW